MLHIVYLDDEADLCEVFQAYFERFDMQVHTFIDAEKALSFCLNNQVDMIFLDYRLEDTTGDQIAHRLPKDTPKVLVTGDLNIRVEYHFLTVLTKPYRLSDIKQLIDDTLSTKPQ